MSASLAILNMVILWTGILTAVLVVILRLMGLLRSVRSVELRISVSRRRHESMETCVAYTWPWFDGSSRPSLSLDRLDKSFGNQLHKEYRKSVPS